MKGKKFRGRHKFVCDVDGMEYYSEDKRIRWDGAVVHKNNWEPRHPQDLIKAVKEDTSIKDARPEQPDTFVEDPYSGYVGYVTKDDDGHYIVDGEGDIVYEDTLTIESDRDWET